MVSITPRPHFTPGEDSVPILQEAGWAPEPVWTGGKFRPHRDIFFFKIANSEYFNYNIFSQLHITVRLQFHTLVDPEHYKIH